MKLIRFMPLGKPFQWFLGLAMGLALVSCGGDGDNGSVTGDASGTGIPTATTLSTTLSGDQEVPPVITGAIGSGTLTLDAQSLAVSGGLTLDGLAATAAHVHIGAVGVNGPIIVTLAQTAPGTWTVPAASTLTAEQATAFREGRLYFNAHSAANPNGEVRGQIGREVFATGLSPAQEVPPTASTASGRGVLTIDPATRKLAATLTVTGMAATAAHIHSGAVGVNGPIVFPLTETAAGSGVWVTAADATADDAQLAQLRAGGMYFNAHSTAFPNGEIRGQIARNVGVARLTGGEEVPPTPSTATGTGTLVIDPATRAASGSIQVSGLAPSQAHIHIGPPGVNGPVIVPLANTAPGVWSVPANTTLTAEQFAAFKNGSLYFNAHTAAFPNGEIRGQIR